METSPETIKDISVKVVEDFINHKITMSDGIAKYASEMELNPDQIKRVVETCNTITYLKLQKEASDRTFEFPVADYNTVLATMCLPKEKDGTVKEAEFKQEIEKQAEADGKYEPELQEVQYWAMREFRKNKELLTKLAYDKEECLMSIGDTIELLKKDEWALEKLAEVTDLTTFYKLGGLVNKDVGKTELRDHIFKEAELTQAHKLVELYNKAQELVKEAVDRESLEKRAVAQAMSGMLGKSIGGAIGISTAGAAAGTKGAIKAITNPKKKIRVHPLDIAATAITEPKPESNIWQNLQGSKKRF